MYRIVLIGYLVLTVSLPAAEVVQSDNFSTGGTYSTSAGSSQVSYNVIPTDLLSTTFQPFNSSLGTLDSFTIAWTLDVTWNYVNGADGTNSVTGGVTAYLNDVAYNGTGGGIGYSYPGSGTLSIHPDKSVTYTVADSLSGTGSTLWAMVTGSAPFVAKYASGINANLKGDATIDLTATSNVTLTYSYSPVPEPATAGLLLGIGVLAVALYRRRRKRDGEGSNTLVFGEGRLEIAAES